MHNPIANLMLLYFLLSCRVFASILTFSKGVNHGKYRKAQKR
jgi:hypothetical protein